VVWTEPSLLESRVRASQVSGDSALSR